MKKTAVAALAVLACGLLVAESAFAHGPRTRVGISIGVPVVGFGFGYGYGYGGYYPSRYYYPPYYYPYSSYYPEPVAIQQQPPVYVEQGQQSAPSAQPSVPAYWYYCADSRAYYPHVKQCASGWQRVAPQPG